MRAASDPVHAALRLCRHKRRRLGRNPGGSRLRRLPVEARLQEGAGGVSATGEKSDEGSPGGARRRLSLPLALHSMRRGRPRRRMRLRMQRRMRQFERLAGRGVVACAHTKPVHLETQPLPVGATEARPDLRLALLHSARVLARWATARGLAARTGTAGGALQLPTDEHDTHLGRIGRRCRPRVLSRRAGGAFGRRAGRPSEGAVPRWQRQCGIDSPRPRDAAGDARL